MIAAPGVPEERGWVPIAVRMRLGQSLLDAVNNTPGAVVAASIPAS